MNTLPQTVFCPTCKEEKPIERFYAYRGEIQKPCKDCRKGHRQIKGKFTPTVPSQHFAVVLLSEIGIFATPGKHSAYNYVDVVAWGCVRIEVKYSGLGKRQAFIFGFTKKQQEEGISADLLWLMCDYGDKLTHHIFEVNHPIIQGAMQSKISCLYYKPDRMTQHRFGSSHSLTDAIMLEAENHFDLIEQCRIGWNKDS